MDPVYPNEKSLFTIAVILASIIWLIVLIATFGGALLFVLVFFIAYLFGHSAFITYIKGTGVKVSNEQFPDIHLRVQECALKIGMTEIPDVYVLRTDFFNALATKFLGRRFVVLFSDVIDSLENHPRSLNFYLGHELGHLHRKHLQWGPFLSPALVLPVLGAAYSRACEYTCDRYGLMCCDTADDARFAIAAIASGNSRLDATQFENYAAQSANTGEFWMSFHELTGDYPWMTKRMAAINSLALGQEPKSPRRSYFAGILSIFVPRFGVGGIMSIWVAVAVVGVLTAIAIPGFEDYKVRSEVKSALDEVGPFREAVVSYTIDNNVWPDSILDIDSYFPDGAPSVSNYVEVADGGIVIVTFADSVVAGQHVIFEPRVDDGVVGWYCHSPDMEKKYLPARCRL